MRDSQNRRIDADDIERAVAEVHARRGRGLHHQDALAPSAMLVREAVQFSVLLFPAASAQAAGISRVENEQASNPLRVIRPRCGRAGRVEVAFLRGHRLVWDSKLGDASPVLAVNPTEWSAFTAVVKAGRLDG